MPPKPDIALSYPKQYYSLVICKAMFCEQEADAFLGETIPIVDTHWKLDNVCI